VNLNWVSAQLESPGFIRGEDVNDPAHARNLAAKVDEAIQLWDEMTDTEPARLGVLEDHWRRKRNQEWPWALPFLRNGGHFGESEREIHVVGSPPCP
jgi:hypothetical protein